MVYFARTDAHAVHNGRNYQRAGKVTEKTIASHRAGETIIGSYCIDPLDQCCRWCCWDFDAHDDPAEKDALEPLVIEAANILRDKASVWPLVEDSGRGYHIWIFFEDPVPARDLRAWNPIEGAEFFPKQDEIGPKGYGNLVRLPGRHPKLEDFWSKLWSDGEWLPWSEAEDAFFDPQLSESWHIPAAPAAPALSEAPQGASERPKGLDSAIFKDEDKKAAQEALERLTADVADDREGWITVGMALHHEFKAEGFPMWAGWSQQSPKWDLSEGMKQWMSFDRPRTGAPVTLGTLIKMASEAPVTEQRRAAQSHLDNGGSETRDEAREAVNSLWNIELVRVIQRGSEAGLVRFSAIILKDGAEVEVQIGSGDKLLSQAFWRRRMVEAGRLRLEVVGEDDKDKSKNWKRITIGIIEHGLIDHLETDETVRGILMEQIAEYVQLENISLKGYRTIQTRAPFKHEDRIYVNSSLLSDYLARVGCRPPETISTTVDWLKLCGAVKSKEGARDGDRHATGRYWSVPISDVDPDDCGTVSHV